MTPLTTQLRGPLGAARPAAGPDVTPGTMPAWAVVFSAEEPTGLRHLLTIGSDSYDASLSLTLPGDLSGGRYEVVVEGLIDDDYRTIRLRTGSRLAAAIHLWWRDSPAGVLGDLARVAGLGDLLGRTGGTPPAGTLVAVIRVDTLRRQAGERRYDTVISGRERVVARLGETGIRQGLCYTSLDTAARGVARGAGVDVVTHGLEDLTPAAGDEKIFADVRPGNALLAMQTVSKQAAAAMRRRGLSTAIVRDGVLHVGLWTARDPATAPMSVVRTLDAAGGLVSAERGADKVEPAKPGRELELPTGGATAGSTAGAAQPDARARITATALGRPDIKPGDVVRIPLPPEDFPILAVPGPRLPVLRELQSLRDPDVPPDKAAPCLVTQVTHRISRRQGFVTTVQASVLRDDDSDDGWDRQDGTAAPRDGADRSQRGSKPADHAASTADAVESVARAVAKRLPGVRLNAGQIRGHPAAAQAGAPPQNSSEVWYATVPSDGTPALRRAPITPAQHGELPPVPVVTPFAHGGFGLVLPRYPGSRVLLADTGGGGGDVVDLGGVWEHDVSPPAQPGDWWLILPISLPTDDLAPSDDTSPPRSEDASHDLIDGDGRRVIEVAGLTLRVLDEPTKCTERPDPGPTGSVIIENTKGDKSARIEVRSDGSITVTGSSISFDAGSGDISMKAGNVKVSVTGTMDVS
ncbi:MAG TPA: hypothetical protein VF657_01310 [Actinoplanes sp.]